MYTMRDMKTRMRPFLGRSKRLHEIHSQLAVADQIVVSLKKLHIAITEVYNVTLYRSSNKNLTKQNIVCTTTTTMLQKKHDSGSAGRYRDIRLHYSRNQKTKLARERNQNE